MKCVLWCVLLYCNRCSLLALKNMERNKMHSMTNIKFTDAQQATAIYSFKNTKEKFVGPTQLFGIKSVHESVCVFCDPFYFIVISVVCWFF